MTDQHTGRGPSSRAEFIGLASKCVGIFLVANAITLATVAGTSIMGGATNSFMWVRAVILVAAAPFLRWMTRRAGDGNDPLLRRLTVVATVLPVAVIVVDFIPGVAPAWYGVLQGLGALALVPVAVTGRRWNRDPVGA